MRKIAPAEVAAEVAMIHAKLQEAPFGDWKRDVKLETVNKCETLYVDGGVRRESTTRFSFYWWRVCVSKDGTSVTLAPYRPACSGRVVGLFARRVCGGVLFSITLAKLMPVQKRRARVGLWQHS